MRKKKRKAYDPLKQAGLLARQRLKHHAIGCVAAKGPCQLLDLRTKTPVVMDRNTFTLVSEIRHSWTVFMAVIGLDFQNQPYMKSSELTVQHPTLQANMVETLNTHHAELIQSFNKKDMISVGWLATPYIHEWDTHEAFKLLEQLGALDFERTPENEIVPI